jgi:DNA-binding beta-propeller fold protein YncE
VAGSFSTIIDLAVDGSGNVYIDDETYSNIRKFDSSLGAGTTIISAGTAAGQVSSPFCIAVDTDGNLLVGDDPGPGRVQKFSPTGTYLTAIASPASETFGLPTGIAVDANTKDVYIADFTDHVVFKYAPY